MWKQALLAASLLLPLTCAPAEAAKVRPLIGKASKAGCG